MGAKTGAAIEEAVASAATPPEGCALITGSSRGIGAAIATELAGAGWPVARQLPRRPRRRRADRRRGR